MFIFILFHGQVAFDILSILSIPPTDNMSLFLVLFLFYNELEVCSSKNVMSCDRCKII